MKRPPGTFSAKSRAIFAPVLEPSALARRISASFRMEVVRDAFVTSLAKFTTLVSGTFV